MIAIWVLHSANIAVTLNDLEKSFEPHQWPLYWRKHRFRCQASDPIICKANGIGFPGPVKCADILAPSSLASLVKCSCCYAVSQHLILGPLTQPRSIACAPLCKCTNVSITYIMMYAVWPQLTHRSPGRELGQEGMCNRVRDRYEDKVVRTFAQASRSSRCGRQLCKQHERSNMWYQRKLIQNMYSTTAYAGLRAMGDLPRFIVYHSDVMWPYYTIPKCLPNPGPDQIQNVNPAGL
jgi:hypothetical protein